MTVGSLFERSHIRLSKWLLAVHLMSASKKGISAHQLHRMLNITYKSSWFMCHRIRESMKPKSTPPMGGNGGMVEVDETFIGNKGKNKKGATGYAHKEKVLTLVERKTGKARSFHVDAVNVKTLKPILMQNLKQDTHLMTDEAGQYGPMGKEFADHSIVKHERYQFVSGAAHTNTIEGFFSIFKRGMKGVYQHCSASHLQRYLNEFDFRYSNRTIEDWERANIALKGIEGRRLTYRRIDQH